MINKIKKFFNPEAFFITVVILLISGMIMLSFKAQNQAAQQNQKALKDKETSFFNSGYASGYNEAMKEFQKEAIKQQNAIHDPISGDFRWMTLGEKMNSADVRKYLFDNSLVANPALPSFKKESQNGLIPDELSSKSSKNVKPPLPKK